MPYKDPAKRAAYALAYRDKKNARARERYWADPEAAQRAIRNRRKRPEVMEKSRACCRAYYHRNPERFRAYEAANREKLNAKRRVRDAERRAKKDPKAAAARLLAEAARRAREVMSSGYHGTLKPNCF